MAEHIARLAAQAEKAVILSEKGPSRVVVVFKVHFHVEFGQHIFITGADTLLGNWQAETAVSLNWTEGDQWTVTLDFPGNTYLEYKFIIKAGGEVVRWEEGVNHRMTLPKHSIGPVKVFDSWGGGA